MCFSICDRGVGGSRELVGKTFIPKDPFRRSCLCAPMVELLLQQLSFYLQPVVMAYVAAFFPPLPLVQAKIGGGGAAANKPPPISSSSSF